MIGGLLFVVVVGLFLIWLLAGSPDHQSGCRGARARGGRRLLRRAEHGTTLVGCPRVVAVMIAAALFVLLAFAFYGTSTLYKTTSGKAVGWVCAAVCLLLALSHALGEDLFGAIQWWFGW